MRLSVNISGKGPLYLGFAVILTREVIDVGARHSDRFTSAQSRSRRTLPLNTVLTATQPPFFLHSIEVITVIKNIKNRNNGQNHRIFHYFLFISRKTINLSNENFFEVNP